MPIRTINDVWDNVETIDKDLSQGHVSIQEASQAVQDINKAWDDFANDCDTRLGVNLSTLAPNQDVFDAFGGIKQGAVTGVGSVSSFFNAVDSFKGSWRNPEEARRKLETGLTQISDGVKQFGTTIRNIAKTGSAISNMLGIGKPGTDANGNPILDHPVLDGIGTFGGSLNSFATSFDNSGIIGLAGRMSGVISQNVNARFNGTATGGAAFVTQEQANKIMQEDDLGSEDGSLMSPQNNMVENGAPLQANWTSGTGVISEDDYSADLIHEITVILDGGSASEVSMCTINGEKYRLTGYSISQELLQPMILNFSLSKDDKTETDKDVIFRDSTQLIGKSIEIKASSRKTSMDEGTSTDAFDFKGVIIDVNASRTVASAQSASIVAASYDCLLQNAPHCRSFEDKTLKEIVESVLQPYKDIQGVINPRFASKIPYVVQYNQSDFDFIRMLAVRFGEWMYNTGTKFIFGEFDNSNAATASLQYPGGSLMSYGLSQEMNSFAFNHLLNNHYAFGTGKETIKNAGNSQADAKYNDWTEKAYEASKQRFVRGQITALFSGGFDNQKDNEGADTITEYSVKVLAHGQKARLMTVHGSSKLAMLKIGQTFVICDSAQNVSGQNTDIKQNALRIIGINHAFDYSQDYSNSFTAVPNACNYPSYSNANVFPTAPSQRATVVDNKDEQKLGRIRVQFPWQKVQDDKMMSPWLRIAVPYGGNIKGHLFVPEIGEEVMVGFEMDNAERPYIIGALYNGGKGKPDEEWAASKEDKGTSNNIKAIRTRNGHTILFNDRGDAGVIEIYDNKNNTYHITLSADDKKITIYSAGDIEINADGSISMTAKDNVNIKANSNVSVNADKEVTIQASKVKVR